MQAVFDQRSEADIYYQAQLLADYYRRRFTCTQADARKQNVDPSAPPVYHADGQRLLAEEDYPKWRNNQFDYEQQFIDDYATGRIHAEGVAFDGRFYMMEHRLQHGRYNNSSVQASLQAMINKVYAARHHAGAIEQDKAALLDARPYAQKIEQQAFMLRFTGEMRHRFENGLYPTEIAALYQKTLAEMVADPDCPALLPLPADAVAAITDEHIAWYHTLSDDWKKIFGYSVRHAYWTNHYRNHCKHDYRDAYVIYGDSDVLAAPIDAITQKRDLAWLFSCSGIVFDYINEPNWITALPDLRYFQNLKRLSLGDALTDTLVGLENIHSLEYFFGWRGKLSDLSPLRNNTRLTELLLAGNKITDISVLADFTELEELILVESGKVKDFSALQHLHKLRDLTLDGKRLTDCPHLFDILPKLPALKEVCFSTPVDADDLACLQALMPDCQISSDWH